MLTGKHSGVSFLALATLCIPGPGARAAETRQQLPEVVIHGARLDRLGGNGVVRPVTAGLRTDPGLRLAPQGIGAQMDLQIHGSSFSGAGFALDGLALRSPQTEHFHTELPLPGVLFDSATLRTGLDQAREAAGHFVGTVDFAFAPVTDRGGIEYGVGEFNRKWQSAFVQLPFHGGERARSGALTFFGRRDNGDGDPLRGNGLEVGTLGGHVQFATGDARTDLAAAYRRKTFGAQGYYGAPATLPSLETVRDRLLFSSTLWGDRDGEFTRLAVLYRDLSDTYTLDRTRSGLYQNRHRSRTLGLGLDGDRPMRENLSVRWRIDASEEHLNSHYQGTIPAAALGDQRRARAALTLVPELTLGALRLDAGMRAAVFTDDVPAYMPVAGIAYEFAPGQRGFVSCTETVRLPSYTELNYNSPGSLGNAGLERQEGRTWELGCEGALGPGCHWRALVFHRDEQDAVDWIRTVPGGRWTAVNLRRVRVRGVDARVDWRVREELHLKLGYAHLNKTSETTPYSSRYVLDYPEHQVHFGIVWRPAPWCELSTVQAVSRQVSNATRDGDRLGVDGSVRAALSPPKWPRLRITVELENMWNDDHEALPGLPSAGRRVSAAAAWVW